jgi:hypothetical protein
MSTTRDEHDRAFEQILLDSARADAVTDPQKERAWQALSQAMGAAVVGGGLGAGARRLSEPWHGAPARWLAIGALGGAAVSALMLGRTPNAAPAAHPRALTTAAVSVVTSAQLSPGPAPSPAATATAEPSATTTPPPRVRPNVAVPSAASPHAVARAPGLEPEIAALDAARTALRERAPARALGLLEEYAQAFPRGQLHLEAEVVAIRALEMQGLWSEADRRASAYLAQHPDDPHAAALRLRSDDTAP